MKNNIREVLRLSNRKFLLWLKEFYSDIPKDKWCTGELTDINGNHCAFGHLFTKFTDKTHVYLEHKIREVIDKKDNINRLLYANDNITFRDSRISKLDNPKDRVIKLLNLKLSNRL